MAFHFVQIKLNREMNGGMVPVVRRVGHSYMGF